MKLQQLLTWITAHWEMASSVLTLICYAWLNARNARTAVEKRGGSRMVAIIDRLAVTTMKGAQNKLSAPLLGQSIADEAKAIIAEDATPRVIVGDEAPPSNNGGAQ
jgi:hypothetical protein